MLNGHCHEHFLFFSKSEINNLRLKHGVILYTCNEAELFNQLLTKTYK